MDKITHILENIVRCKYFEVGVHIKNPIKNSYQDGLGRTTQTLDHVVVVHILIWDKKKSQINEYSDKSNGFSEVERGGQQFSVGFNFFEKYSTGLPQPGSYTPWKFKGGGVV
jgi:hypothetical protein